MKKIVFVTGAMGRGGAERVISLLSDYYANKGWAVSIAMLLHNITDGYAINPKVRIVDLSQKNIAAALAIPFVAKRLRKYILQQQPDVVVSFMAQNTLVCGLAWAGVKARLIASERIDPSMVHRNWIFRTALNIIYSQCDRTILQTQRVWAYFPKSVQRNSVVIPNPIQVHSLAAQRWKKRIVTAGRLADEKNHAMLIEAFRDFHDHYPDYCLDIYGEGPNRKSLEDQIQESGLAAHVHLKGSSSRLHEEIADAAMFVLSSSFEGLSNALLEAMMMGLPVISTSCAGADEAIQDGVNGLLVPIKDKAALTSAMSTMAGDEKKMRQLGAAARKDALNRYCMENVISKWDAVIQGSDGHGR